MVFQKKNINITYEILTFDKDVILRFKNKIKSTQCSKKVSTIDSYEIK